MDLFHEIPNVDYLNELSYTELKRVAKNYGLKGNMKAEKIIAELTRKWHEVNSSFSSPLQNELNSSRKNKEDKFYKDMMTPLATPRRGTYSIGSPILLKVEDASKVNDASPLDDTNITVERGSERTLRSHKLFQFEDAVDVSESSAVGVSNVTANEGSKRKLRPRKVSFLSPVVTPRSPRNGHLKLRPKTPIVCHSSAIKRASSSQVKKLKQKRKSSTRCFSATPQPLCDSILEGNTSAMSDVSTVSSVTNGSVSENIVERQDISLVKVSEENTSKSGFQKSPAVKWEKSIKMKRMATPNFRKIHEKAFEKMESIVDYHQRKMDSAKKIHFNSRAKVTKPKSKIPALNGIPFVPSLSSKLDLKRETKITSGNKKLKTDENICQRTRTKFDLKASLSRKLNYRPYKGPMKPLADSNVLNTSSALCHRTVKESDSKIVIEKRIQNRSLLKGVRTNKRFELQMKNRKVV